MRVKLARTKKPARAIQRCLGETSHSSGQRRRTRGKESDLSYERPAVTILLLLHIGVNDLFCPNEYWLPAHPFRSQKMIPHRIRITIYCLIAVIFLSLLSTCYDSFGHTYTSDSTADIVKKLAESQSSLPIYAPRPNSAYSTLATTFSY